MVLPIVANRNHDSTSDGRRGVDTRPWLASPRSTSRTSTTSRTAFRTTCSRSTGARRRCGGTSRPTHTPDGEGFWSVATHAETLAVLRDPDTFSSERGGARPHGGTLLQDLAVAGIVLNMMDDPRHARIRRLVSTGLTPRTVGRLEAELRRRTRALARRDRRRRRVRLPRRRRGRAADAGDLHPARRARSRPARARRPRSSAGFDIRAGDAASATDDAERRADADVRVRRRAHRRRSARIPPTTCCRSSCTRRSPTSSRRASPTSSCTRSSRCCSRPAPRRRATRSRAALLALIERPDQLAALRRIRAPPGRDRGDAALDDAVAVEAAHRDGAPSSAATRSNPATRSCSGRGRPTATSASSWTRWSSTSAATRTRTSRSGTACTTASARISPGSRCG